MDSSSIVKIIAVKIIASQLKEAMDTLSRSRLRLKVRYEGPQKPK